MSNQIYEYFDVADNVNENTFGSVYGKNAVCYVGQTFTIGTTGTNEDFVIETIKLRLTKAGTPTGNLDIAIWDTDATTYAPKNIIATGTIALSDISTINWYSCTNMVGNITLRANTRYAVTISHTNATAINYVEFTGDDTSSGDYGGDTTTQNIGGAWIRAFSEIDWSKVSTGQDVTDFKFQILGSKWTSTLCTYSEIKEKAGADTNATGSSIDNVTIYARLCESVLNTRTRKNWTDIYSTLNEDVKYMINEIVSDLSAIKVINYDMSSMDRLEAEDRKLTLKNNAELLIQELKDQKIQEFIQKNA